MIGNNNNNCSTNERTNIFTLTHISMVTYLQNIHYNKNCTLPKVFFVKTITIDENQCKTEQEREIVIEIDKGVA